MLITLPIQAEIDFQNKVEDLRKTPPDAWLFNASCNYPFGIKGFQSGRLESQLKPINPGV
jgi:hypothetical protein